MARRDVRRNSPLRRKHFSLESLESRLPMAASPLTPLAGDWNADGIETVGFYDSATGKFLLSDSNESGFVTTSFIFSGAKPGMTALAGDWDGNGTATVGLYDPATGTVLLRNRNASGRAEITLRTGLAGGQALAGDWDGDERDTPAIFYAATGELHALVSNNPATAVSVLQGDAAAGDAALVGDWDGNNRDTLGLVDTASGELRLSTQWGEATDQVFAGGAFGAGFVPLAGDWNGDGLDTLGRHERSSDINTLAWSLESDGFEKEFYLIPSLDTTRPPAKAVRSRGALAAGPVAAAGGAELSAGEVETLLRRAAAASASQDAIIAIVDRQGNILGVRVEAGVLTTIPDLATRVFAIDGAVAKARTAAFFANGDPTNGPKGTVGPLTSRTVRFISQSTVTEREVESNPSIGDLNSTERGPGFVAPIGLGAHFPPEVAHTPPVDLFAIEHTNRDSLVHPGPDGIRGSFMVTLDTTTRKLLPSGVTGDDISLDNNNQSSTANRFNTLEVFTPQKISAPESYGYVSGTMTNAQARGIATLPGGLPIYRNGSTLIGGIGVFFPGPDGYATHEQRFVPGIGQTEKERTNAPLVLESEWIAYAAVGGAPMARPFVGKTTAVGTLDGIAPISDIFLPFGRIDLVGITLEIYGPGNPAQGINALLKKGREVAPPAGLNGSSASGSDFAVLPPGSPLQPGETLMHRNGQEVPEGWIVLPHGSGSLSTADVQQIVAQGIAEADRVRAAIRLKPGKPLATAGARTRMVFAVADLNGEILGLFRMQDATYFSIDVAVAKSRNVAYYADASALQPIDQVDDNLDGAADIAAGVAFTNRTFRFLAEPRFPDGVDGTRPPPFSILGDPGINPRTAENLGAPAPASAFTTVLGFDAFNPGRNFRDPGTLANQNGIVFFPGSSPLYESNVLVGGFGVSGDGVDQDDVVTFQGQKGYQTPPAITRADQVFVRGVRLPFQKFNRTPRR